MGEASYEGLGWIKSVGDVLDVKMFGMVIGIWFIIMFYNFYMYYIYVLYLLNIKNEVNF